MIRFGEWIKIREGAAVGPYIGGCEPHKDFIVQGACSQLNTEKQNKKYRKGEFARKKSRAL